MNSRPDPSSRVIVALDNMDVESCFELLAGKLAGKIKIVKIGLELFCQHGPDLVSEMHRRFGVEIFLDLKLHDIPNTVSKAIKSLAGLPISFLTLHLQGGEAMLAAAQSAKEKYLPQTNLLGVSFLTSLGEEDFSAVWNFSSAEITPAFSRLFRLATKCKLGGVVLSAQELSICLEVERSSQEKLVKVCPGIRFADEISTQATQDQKRVFTPQQAFAMEADYLVIGRSITAATADQLDTRLKTLATAREF